MTYLYFPLDTYYWVINMKATDLERQRFDKALDEILDLFNNIEEEVSIINFSEDVIDNIGRAKKKYGDELVDEKINTIVSEMLSWLDLDIGQGDDEEEVDAEEDEDEED